MKHQLKIEKQQHMAFWDECVNTALTEVGNERLKQALKWGLQDHSLEKWILILTEEVGELAEAILEEKPEQAKEEAVQIAAVAAAIIQKLNTDKPV